MESFLEHQTLREEERQQSKKFIQAATLSLQKRDLSEHVSCVHEMHLQILVL